jgi:ferredoxin-NADP reductase
LELNVYRIQSIIGDLKHETAAIAPPKMLDIVAQIAITVGVSQAQFDVCSNTDEKEEEARSGAPHRPQHCAHFDLDTYTP